jgi:hypothetical protein
VRQAGLDDRRRAAVGVVQELLEIVERLEHF